MKKHIAFALVLIIMAGVLLFGCGPAKESEMGSINASTPGGIEAKPGDDPVDPAETAEPVEPKEPTDDEIIISLPLSRLKEYAQSSSAVWEFIQRFFTNTIVYKDKLGNFVYAPVDNSLPKSNYNFDNLVNINPTGTKELEYVENGVTTSIKGIDVSQYQADIDWEKVAADGVKFVMIRAGYRGYGTGKLVQDTKFEDNIQGALKNNVAVGIYFVTQAVSEEEAVEEADFVLEMIKPYRVTWPIVLDIEEAGGGTGRTAGLTADERTTYTLAFCDRIKEFGYVPMLYCNIRWFMEELDLSRLTLVDKWFAQYFNRPFFPYEFTMWQYSSTGKVDGIKGNVDLNLSFRDYGQGEN